MPQTYWPFFEWEALCADRSFYHQWGPTAGQSCNWDLKQNFHCHVTPSFWADIKRHEWLHGNWGNFRLGRVTKEDLSLLTLGAVTLKRGKERSRTSCCKNSKPGMFSFEKHVTVCYVQCFKYLRCSFTPASQVHDLGLENYLSQPHYIHIVPLFLRNPHQRGSSEVWGCRWEETARQFHIAFAWLRDSLKGKLNSTVFQQGLWVGGLERSRVLLSERKKRLKFRSIILAVRRVVASRQLVVGAGGLGGGECS